jgi:hypothetical protein
MAIDNETRERAMAAVRRRLAGEATDEEIEQALSGMSERSKPRRSTRRSSADSVDKTPPTVRSDSKSSGAPKDDYGVPSLTPNAGKEGKSESDMSAGDRLERTLRNISRSFPGSGPAASLDAILGPTAGGVARNAGRFVGGLGESAVSGFKAGRASAAAERAAERATRDRSQSSRSEAEDVMVNEGGRRITPKMPRGPNARARDREEERFADEGNPNFKKGGKVPAASRRADGIATKGKTRGKMC